MTTRELFAAHAAQGILASGTIDELRRMAGEVRTDQWVAINAVTVADALIEMLSVGDVDAKIRELQEGAR